MKHLTITLSAAIAGCLVLTGCKPSVKQPPQWETTETTTRTEAEDSAATAEMGTLTFAKAMELVEPGKSIEPTVIEQLFASMNLPMLLADHYISDADYGGDSPAISYCFGNNVKYEDYKFSPTSERYYGVHTNFFFDDTRKTGTVNRFAIITSDSLWHAQLMDDAAAAGLKYKEDVDPNVYGKKGKLFQKNGKKVNGSSEYATYYIFDFSTSGHFDVEVGYDSGMDI